MYPSTPLPLPPTHQHGCSVPLYPSTPTSNTPTWASLDPLSLPRYRLNRGLQCSQWEVLPYHHPFTAKRADLLRRIEDRAAQPDVANADPAEAENILLAHAKTLSTSDDEDDQYITTYVKEIVMKRVTSCSMRLSNTEAVLCQYTAGGSPNTCIGVRSGQPLPLRTCTPETSTPGLPGDYSLIGGGGGLV